MYVKKHLCLYTSIYISLLHHEPLDASQIRTVSVFSCFSMLSITFGEFVLPCALASDESPPCSHILKSPPPARPFFKDLRKSSSTPRCQRFGWRGLHKWFAVCFWLLLNANRIRLHVGHTSALLASALIDILKTDSFRMMRYGRENFGRDTPWQWNRPGWLQSHQPSYQINCVWRCVKLEAGHAKTSLYMSGRRAFRMRPRLNSFEGEQVYPCSTEIQADLE